MQTQVTVLRVDQFTSKKGNPCLWVHIAEPNALPFRILIYEKELVANPPAPNSKATLYTDFDSSMIGVLKLKW